MIKEDTQYEMQSLDHINLFKKRLLLVFFLQQVIWLWNSFFLDYVAWFHTQVLKVPYEPNVWRLNLFNQHIHMRIISSTFDSHHLIWSLKEAWATG